jgi:3-isopropylmalate dehydrogenase
MSKTKKLLILPGDGIGPEVMKEVKRVAEWVAKKGSINFDMEDDLVGGAAYDKHGVALADETLEKAMNADAVLLGAVGGPKWDNVAREHRPEAGLLALRKEMDLFANLRPATCMPALAEASSLKEDIVSGLDIMIVRELTAGVYFGQPRGMQTYEGQERCIDTQSYTKAEIERVTEVAFDLARKRGKKVHSVEKANVMESGIFWRGVVSDMHKNGGYEDIELNHMYADNCAMQLVRWPKQFDVIVTDNLFGDILSDCAAMLTGSLGMLPSASLGAKDANGKAKALYEPVHGSAPDIAGKGLANPLASILSFSMCLRYSFDMGKEADLIETAAQNVLNSGTRTADIMQPGMAKVSTSVMGDALLREMDNLS